MHFDFFTYLVYSPRGVTKNAEKSKRLLGLCKNGSPKFSVDLAESIINNKNTEFFKDSILVPTPRSAPLVLDGVFPSRVIAENLVKKNLSSDVITCLKRIKVIPKSSSQYTAELRNSVQTHLDSLAVSPMLITKPNIILIDDVLTLGRTSMACAIKLKEQYPEHIIKIFCVFRTRSLNNNNDLLVDPQIGTMILSTYNKVILPD